MKRKSLWRGLGICLGGVLAVAFATYAYGLRTMAVAGESMLPTARPGDTLVALVGPHHVKKLERFDVALFEVPPGLGAGEFEPPWVRRVIGLPGEHLRLDGAEIIVDGKAVTLPQVIASANFPRTDVRLGTDEFYVLGDNRQRQLDSRLFGAVPRSLMRGYVVKIIRGE
jgi:signal peptidase I